MRPTSTRRWRLLSRLLKIAGATGCLVVFLWVTLLVGYYDARRPHVPQPESGWTVGLTWTHPTSYGTAQEEDRLLWWHWSFFTFFTLMALGEIIKIYKLDDYSGIAHYFRNKPWFRQP